MGNNKSDYILAKFDVGGIQDYIFATNACGKMPAPLIR